MLFSKGQHTELALFLACLGTQRHATLFSNQAFIIYFKYLDSDSELNKHFQTFKTRNGNGKQCCQPNFGKKFIQSLCEKLGKGISAHAWINPCHSYHNYQFLGTHTWFSCFVMFILFDPSRSLNFLTIFQIFLGLFTHPTNMVQGTMSRLASSHF